MFTPSCRSCRHWECRINERSGVCRFSPPRSLTLLAVTDDPELRVVWPTTLADDRCGAWNGSAYRDRGTANAGRTSEAG